VGVERERDETGPTHRLAGRHLGSFAVVGCQVALGFEAPFVVAVFMGMLRATGGGVIRDVLTGTQPMILSAGELYATAALGGAFVYALTIHLRGSALIAQLLGFLTVLILRAASIVFGMRTGPPGAFPRWGRPGLTPRALLLRDHGGQKSVETNFS
jgi:hypothetical protein